MQWYDPGIELQVVKLALIRVVRSQFVRGVSWACRDTKETTVTKKKKSGDKGIFLINLSKLPKPRLRAKSALF